MAVPKLHNLPYRFYDITVEFPEFPEGERCLRHRRVQGVTQVEAVRRVFSDHGGFPFEHRNRAWKTVTVTCRKVESYE